MDGGASAGVADQQPSPSTVAEGTEVSNDDRDLLGLTTKIHPPEVRGWRFAVVLSFPALLIRLSLAWYEARISGASPPFNPSNSRAGYT